MNELDSLAAHPLVLDLGWTLLHFVWQGTAIAIVLGLVLFLLRARTANVRYVASCAGMLGMVVLPVLTFGYLGASRSDTATRAASSGLKDSALEWEQGDLALEPSRGFDEGASTLPVLRESNSPSLWERTSGVFWPILPWLVLGWFMGVTVLSLRLLGGWLWAERLRRFRVTAVGDDWNAVLGRIARRLGVSRPVRLLSSALVEAPVLLGYLRPVILLPVSAIIGLSQEQLEAVLAHELAHVRRCDYLVRLLQTLVETLLFYHPAVWWVSRQMTNEREYCCDDLAAKACGDTLCYARALVSLEELRGRVPQLALAVHGAGLVERIHRLVGASHNRPSDGTLWQGAFISVAVLLACALAIPLSVSAAQQSAPPAGDAARGDSAIPVTSPEGQATAAAAPAAGTLNAAAKTAPEEAEDIGVALLEFNRIGAAETLGQTSAQMYELVTERLANAPGVRLVDRDRLTKAMEEVRLSQTGLVDAATATRLGKIVGARIFIAGKLMKLGPEYVVTVRLIDTQTSEVKALRVTTQESDGVVRLAEATADRVAERLATWTRSGRGSGEGDSLAADIEALRAKLAGRELPVVAVSVPESHIGTWVPDPAGESEIIAVLSQVGFRVVDVNTLMQPEPGSWWLNIFYGRGENGEGAAVRLNQGSRSAGDIVHDARLKKIVEKTDVYIIGEAFSEFESFKGRVEVKAIDTKAENVVAAVSRDAVAADIAELAAGKKALQAAGGQVGLAVAKQIAEFWEKGRPASAAVAAQPAP